MIEYLSASTSRTIEIETQHSYWTEIYPEYQEQIPDMEIETKTFNHDLYQQYTYNGKTAYYAQYSGGYGGEIQNMPEVSSVEFDGKAAWTMLYGTISGGVQLIPVQWTRPGDFRTLEGNFGVTVN